MPKIKYKIRITVEIELKGLEKFKMPKLSDRVGTFTDSVIRRMTRICNKYNAINLSQGFPDWDPPVEMMNALEKAAHKGPHQYAITFGAKNLRDAICEKQGKAIGRTLAMMTICNPGDKVLVFSPFYENYGADAILSGAEPIYVPLVPPEYNFDINIIENGFKSGAKAIVICNPSNPCGKVFTEKELTEIGALAKKYDAFIITDEVYEHIIFDDNKHVYASALPGLFDNVITCNSMSKTYSITGWRLGYLIGPERVVEGARKVHDFLTVGAASPLQEAAVTAFKFPKSYYDELQAKYASKRDRFLKGLDEIGLKHNVPAGTYFVMVNIDEFLELDQFKNKTDLEFCEWACENVGVAAVPGSSFFREDINNLIRFHFARSDEVIDEAINRLGNLKALLK